MRLLRFELSRFVEGDSVGRAVIGIGASGGVTPAARDRRRAAESIPRPPRCPSRRVHRAGLTDVSPRERQRLAQFLGVTVVGLDVDRALESNASSSGFPEDANTLLERRLRGADATREERTAPNDELPEPQLALILDERSVSCAPPGRQEIGGRALAS